MSLWFSKRDRSGVNGQFSASVPFTMIFMLLVLAVMGVLALLGWLRS
ncbi:hypothetical protein OT109_07115 [Phycisphaeraceae bacterium D3-23]